jgi:hypothetical protein
MTTRLGYATTYVWCEDCLPDTLIGLHPMPTFSADVYSRCDECGVELHGEDLPASSRKDPS